MQALPLSPSTGPTAAPLRLGFPAGSKVPAGAAAASLTASLRVWLSKAWPGARNRTVTAVMVGETCAVVRLQSRPDGLHLLAAEHGGPADLRRWKKLFRGSLGVLVLRSEERYLLALDKPEVPDAELNLAIRWPMGEALSVEPEELLTTALPLPRSNEAARPQVLGIAARIEAVKGQLAGLRKAGIDVRSIDVVDSALRGMALLQADLPQSAVAIALVGNTMSIGLIQQGRIAALRSVPLPEREGHADAELAEQLALNARRTFDHYERQAMLNQRSLDHGGASVPMAVGRALASVATLSDAGLETFCSALPDAPMLFDLRTRLRGSPELHERCLAHDELTALVCVATARLFDTGPVAMNTPPSASPDDHEPPAAKVQPASAAAGRTTAGESIGALITEVAP